AARPRIANEVCHVGSVTTLDNANPAIDHCRGYFTARIECGACVTRVGPFPDTASHIEQPIFVRPEAADGTPCLVEPVLAVRVSIINSQRALTGIADIKGFRQGIIVKPAGRRVSPLLVCRQAESLACLAR